MGDFNAITWDHVHRGSNTQAKGPMLEFQAWTDSNHLIHLPTQEAFFTWSNKRDPIFPIERRINRVISNQLWLDNFSRTSVCTLPKIHSYHLLILMEFFISTAKMISQFRFLKTWTLHQDRRKFIADNWKRNVVGCPTFVLCKKLYMLKRDLNLWNHTVFGNATHNVALAERNLNNIQLNSGTGSNLCRLEKEAQDQLAIALDMEECFLKEKSITKWHLEGDQNTEFSIILPKSGMPSSLLLC